MKVYGSKWFWKTKEKIDVFMKQVEFDESFAWLHGLEQGNGLRPH